MLGDGSRSSPPPLAIREGWLATLLVAALVVMPAVSVQAAGWSERLEPVPWIALAGVGAGAAIARTRLQKMAAHLAGLSVGLILVTFQYAWFIPVDPLSERLQGFVHRVAEWLQAAFSGMASTDNLLFAYTMGLLAWLIGYVGSWGAFRALNPWWTILPSGAALLLNLSYAQPDLLPLIFLHLGVSFALLVHLNSVATAVRWRSEGVEHTLNQGTGFALTSVAVGVAIIFAAWRMPVGEVHRGVAGAWETVAGPWQALQVNFDRLFASLSPSPQSGRGLAVSQTMAPRGAFELGDKPIMRVAGREPAYWRAATYDLYTGRVMTTSQTTPQRLDRRQPIDGTIETEEGRKFVEYTVTLLAPSSSVVYAPDAPVTVSIPSVYEYRTDRRDYSSLRPVTPVREQQRYSVLASVSTASIAELRQADSAYPAWTRAYLQLPPGFPESVRQESWRVVGNALNAYDAAANIERYLRGFKYSTRVRVPPAGRDWVSFLILDSKEGYCDYYGTAMTVMLRAVGIPARVATGYVTGDWDPSRQSYLVTEQHAHTWTEVYFPDYGWITFEPSAIRPGPTRLEKPLVSLSEEELLRLMEADLGADEFLEDEDLFDTGNLVSLPAGGAGLPLPAAVLLLLALVGVPLAGLLVAAALWLRGMARLPVFARPYAQVVRLTTWSGLGPRASQTPYEYTRDLARLAPGASGALQTIADAYVAGRYGAKNLDSDAFQRLAAAGAEARRVLFHTLAIGRWRQWCSRRLRDLVGAERPR